MTRKPQSPRFDNITIFETEDGRTRVEVRFEHENVWLPQKLMAEPYECSADNISLHLKNIFADKELEETSVTEDSSVTAADDGRRQMQCANAVYMCRVTGVTMQFARMNGISRI